VHWYRKVVSRVFRFFRVGAPRSLDCLSWFHSFIARVDFQSHPPGLPTFLQELFSRPGEPSGACVRSIELRLNSIYPAARLLANSGSNRVPLLSMAQRRIRIELHRLTSERVRAALSRAGAALNLLECGCSSSPNKHHILDLCCSCA
jgi:hypothetical protein